MAPPVVKSGFAGSCPIRLVLPSSPGDFWGKAGHGVDLAPSKTSTDFLQPHVLEHLVVLSLYGFHGFSCSVSCCVLLPQMNNLQPGDSGNIRKCPWKVTPVLGHFFLAQAHGFPSCALCPTAAGLSSTQYEPTTSTEPRLLGAHALGATQRPQRARMMRAMCPRSPRKLHRKTGVGSALPRSPKLLDKRLPEFSGSSRPFSRNSRSSRSKAPTCTGMSRMSGMRS